MNMKVGQSFVASGVGHEFVGRSGSHKPEGKWSDGLECDCIEVNDVALNLVKDVAGDFAEMIRKAANPFL